MILDDDLNNLEQFDLKTAKRKIIIINRKIDFDYNVRLKKVKTTEDFIKLTELKEKRKEVLKMYCDKVERYSSFPHEIIGPMLASLFSLYRGEEYVYKTEVYKGLMIHYLLKTNVNYRRKFCFNSYALADKEENKNVCFYKNDFNILVSKTFLNSNPFIAKFIDFVIEYRMVNNIDVLSEKELKILSYEFVNLHQKEIEKRQQYFSNNEENDEVVLLKV